MEFIEIWNGYFNHLVTVFPKLTIFNPFLQITICILLALYFGGTSSKTTQLWPNLQKGFFVRSFLCLLL